MCITKCVLFTYLVQAASSCIRNGTEHILTASLRDTGIPEQQNIEFCEGNTWTLTCQFNMYGRQEFDIYSYILFRCDDDACGQYYPLVWSIKSNDVYLTLTLNTFFDNKILGCAISHNGATIKGNKIYKLKLYKPSTVSTMNTASTTSTKTTENLTTETRREEAAFRVDYTYNTELNGFLKFHDVPVTWFDAKRLCHYEGATLVSPTNTETTAVLASMMECSDQHQVYTGLNSLNSNGYYYTVEGTPLSSIPHMWAEGEPNNVDGKEHCLVLNTNGSLSDVRCDARRSFVCYRQYRGETVNECDTLDNDYKLYQETNKCYKFHSQSKRWSKAHQICAAENAHLVVINSAVESDVVRRIYGQHPPGSIKISEPQWESVAFVGFRYDNNTDRYETLEGLSLKESGFEEFHPGNPNSPVPGDLCGGVYRSGMLDDTHCQQDHAFICEKIPKRI